jgi:hypothetical protein
MHNLPPLRASERDSAPLPHAKQPRLGEVAERASQRRAYLPPEPVAQAKPALESDV